MKRVHHYAVLDGMRGIAAIVVGCFHCASLFDLPAVKHMELAVGFFFCLSGFLLAHAYDARLRDGLAFDRFMRLRLIRLHPMVLAGVALGLAVTAWGCATGGGAFLGRAYSTGDLITGSLLLLILLPAGLVLKQMLYFIDSPLWSLFFEYVASAAYALTGGRGVRARTAWLIFAALVVVLLPFAVAFGGVTSLGLGNAVMFAGGFARLAVPFFAGIMLRRFNVAERLPACRDIAVMAGLLAFLLYPGFGDAWQYDVLGAALVCPLLVALGARAGGTAVLQPLWRHMGAVSYPFYVLHMPVMKAARHLTEVVYPHSVPTWLAMAGSFAVALLLAEGALYVYDRPVRAWLMARFDGERRTRTATGLAPELS